MNAIDIDSTAPQEIRGSFDEGSSTVYTAIVTLDRYRPWLNEIRFNQQTPRLFNSAIKPLFKLEDGSFFHLHVPSSRIQGHEVVIKYMVYKIEIPNRNDESYIRTGAVGDLLYFPREFRLLGETVFLKSIPENNRIGTRGEYFFEIKNLNSNDPRIEDKLLFCLSALTCTSIWIAEKKNPYKRIFFDRTSASSTMPYIGSGNMPFPIKMADLETLCHETTWDNLRTFHLLYARFVTANDLKYQLFLGCALLDYIIELFVDHFNLKRKYGKSKQLFSVIQQLQIQQDYLDYIHAIFPTLPRSVNLNHKFEFYELRDRHIHRGGLLLNHEDTIQFHRCIVSLNEIIRIILPHIHLIQNWDLEMKNSYESLSSTEIVSTRQALIKWSLS